MKPYATVALLAALGGAAAVAAGPAPGRARTRPGPGARAATPPGTATPPRVWRIARATDLVAGPGANGRIGDLRLDNGLVTAVIDKLGPGQGAAESGGNLVDVVAGGGHDEVRQMFLFLAETFPRQAIYRELDTQQSASEATVVVRGHDSMDSKIGIETTYRLAAGARHVEMVSVFTNRGKEAITGYAVGDVIQWGHAERFLPGQGPRAKGRMVVPWVAGAGRRSAILYGTPDGPFDGIHGSTWSDSVLAKVDLPPGQPVPVRRFVAVGNDGGLASAMEAGYPAMGDAGRHNGRVEGRVTEAGTGRPAAALVVVLVGDAPTTTIATDGEGRFAASLPAGTYRLTTLSRDRAPANVVGATVPEGGAAPPVALAVTPPARLRVDILDERGPCPGKVILEGLGETLDPEFGPAYAAAGAANTAVSLSGHIDLALPPGRYRLTCSRGIEFTIDSQELVVAAGTAGSQVPVHRCNLRRAVETPGRLAFDLHQHAVPSYDAAVSLEDRVIANLAEGLEGFVASDHNVVTDYRKTVERLGVTGRILAVTGNEVTVEGLGHFNVYPVTPRPALRNGGAPDVLGLAAPEIFRLARQMPGGDKVVQINHPRAGREGFFESIRFDPDKPGWPKGWAQDFDAIEVFNGKRMAEIPSVLRDYFEILRRGHAVTAVGNSDTHAIFGSEAGYPRNLVRMGVDDPARASAAGLVKALKGSRDVVVTNGPILEVSIGGVGPGGRAKVVDPARTPVKIRIEAAPWVDVDRVEIFVDGKPSGGTLPVQASSERLRFDRTVEVAVPPGRSVLVTARGSRTLAPVISSLDRKPVTPMALANPIWVEAGPPPKSKPSPKAARPRAQGRPVLFDGVRPVKLQ